jgi:uncharacterized protein (DUF2342 family)
VQSVSLRLICDREAEIEAFRTQEYWTIEVELANAADVPFKAALTHLDGRKLEKFDLSNEAAAEQAAARLRSAATRDLHRDQRRAQADQAQSLSALHHLDPAARGLAQARLRRLAHHAPGAEALRRRRSRRRNGGPHYLHAHRQRAGLERSRRRNTRDHCRQLRRRLPAGERQVL